MTRPKLYKVYDINTGIGIPTKDVYSNSPKSALIKLGYTNATRDLTNKGNVVVYSSRGSYVYYANKETKTNE